MNTNGKIKITREKILCMHNKLMLFFKWEAFLKMKTIRDKHKWEKKCKHTIKILLDKRNVEKRHGGIIKNAWIRKRLLELTWAILWLKILKPLNLNLLLIDLFHTTLRVLERIRLKILLLRETTNVLMSSLQLRIKTLKNTNGPCNNLQALKNNKIMKLFFRINIEQWWKLNVIQIFKERMIKMLDGQTCMEIWTHNQMLSKIWLHKP